MNGKLIFKNFTPYITSPFGSRIHPITKVKTNHLGVDYGTNLKKLPQYAFENGTVLGAGKDGLGGIYAYVKYERLGYVGFHYHLDSVKVKTGQKVDNNTIIGYTGTSGNSTGIHLHFGWFKISEWSKAYNNRRWEDFEKYKFPLKPIGNPLKTNNDQVEVLIDNLRLRKTPNGDILGFIKEGFYDILENKDGWIKIKEGYIGVGDWLKINEATNNLDERLKQLEKELEKIRKENEKLEKEKNDVVEEKEILFKNNKVLVKDNQILIDKILLLEKDKCKFKYLCEKTGYYKIKLYKEEELRVF